MLHLGALHDVAEFRLADQEALQQGVVFELEVGQHAQLLDRRGGEVLRFVNDQQRALARRGDRHEVGLDRQQQAGLVEVAAGHAKSGGDHAQHVVGVDLGADDVGGDHAFGVELLKQAAHDGGLAGTDLAGDDDEAFALVQAVLEVGHRPPVAATTVEEGGIGVELEGLAAEFEECFVHRVSDQNRMPSTAVTAFSV